MQRTRFARVGLLALEPKAWGAELDERGADGERGYELAGDAAVVTIRGPLIQRAEGFLSLFCDSYDRIGARCAAAFACPTAQRVILRIDSPGGDAPGCLEFARELRQMARAAGKPLIALGEGHCCASAAYAIAAAADVIVCTPTCYVGSVGVYEVLLDETAAAAAAGYRVVVVSSGQAKLDRNPHVPVTDEAAARVQAQVDQFADLFFDLVTEMRPHVSVEQLVALDGAVRLGGAAIGAALADHVGVWAEVVAPGFGRQEPRTMSNTKKSFDSAKEALRAVVDDEKCSSDERDKARKSLRALEDEKKEDAGDDKKPEDAAKAEDDKKKDEMAAAKARDDAAAAQALADNSLSLAKKVQEQGAEIARMQAEAVTKAEAGRRAELFGKRPDFSDAVRATLSAVSLEVLEKAVKEWPRVDASSGAAAAALTAGGNVSGGEKVKGAYAPSLTPSEQALLDKVRGKTSPGEAKATLHGNVLQMPADITPEQARARADELAKEIGR